MVGSHQHQIGAIAPLDTHFVLVSDSGDALGVAGQFAPLNFSCETHEKIMNLFSICDKSLDQVRSRRDFPTKRS